MEQGKEVNDILLQLKDNGSTKTKESILIKNNENELLRDTLYAGLSPRVKYYMTKFDDIEVIESDDKITLRETLDEIKKLSARQYTGHSAKRFLGELIGKQPNQDMVVLLLKILSKKLEINIGAKIVNKAFKGLIEETPYQGAKSYSEKGVNELFETSKLPLIVQTKEDGCYANVIVFNGTVECVSRQGEEFLLDNATFLEELKTKTNGVYNGEIVIDGIENRSLANGVINAIKKYYGGFDEYSEKVRDKKLTSFKTDYGFTLEELKQRLRYKPWDYLTIEEYFDKVSSNTPYEDRLYTLKDIITSDDKQIEIVKTTLVNDLESVVNIYQEIVESGGEGIILKSRTAGWASGKPKYQIKFKIEINLDLEITGYRYGTGKNKGVISSVEVQSKDGLLKTVANGLSEKMMLYFTNHETECLGKILEIKCCGLSQDKHGNYSTMHPAIVELRHDKSEANTLEECIEIANSVFKK